MSDGLPKLDERLALTLPEVAASLGLVQRTARELTGDDAGEGAA